MKRSSEDGSGGGEGNNAGKKVANEANGSKAAVDGGGQQEGHGGGGLQQQQQGPSSGGSSSSDNSSSSSSVTPDAAATTSSVPVASSSAGAAASTSSAPSSSSGAAAGASASQQQKPGTLSYVIEDYTPPYLSSNHDLKNSYSWDPLLAEPDFVAAPVTTFKHAPMSDCWDQITVGMKVEVEYKEPDIPPAFSPAFWVASILRISGYKALLRYEGFGQDGTKDFWMSVCSEKIHPVGWCSTRGKPLIPPAVIRAKYADWKDFLIKRLTGARTLPTHFYAKVWESVGSNFRTGMKLEVVDKMRICQVRVATIKDITGRRLFLQYDDVTHDDNGFWCHEESPLIHPVGWAKRVGHQIDARQEYYDRCTLENFDESDCTEDLFPEYVQPPGSFSVGMKLEAVDPLNLASVCVATVMKVLRFGYIMIRIDGYETDETGSDWFCYHASSSLIFPPGFCEKNKIKLKPPAGWEENFTWFNYLRETKSQAAPVGLFVPREECRHGFKVGMKLEAADQMDPRLICVSTISRVVGRLLRVHFDGWEDDYDQWMDCENVDIYPVGWSDLVGHKLEGPRQAAPIKKEKRKGMGGKRGKKRSSGGPGAGTSASASAGAAASSSGVAAGSGGPGRKKGSSPSPAASSSSSSASTTTTTTSSAVADSLSPLPRDLNAPISSRTPPPPVLEPQTTASAPSSGQQPQAQFPESSSSVPSSSSPSGPAVIPRLVDSTGSGQMAAQRGRDANLDPSSWTVADVSKFLEINECATLAGPFAEQGVNGVRFLALAKPDVMKLVNNKIGPCLKVENLLALLKARMNPAQARYQATMRKST